MNTTVTDVAAQAPLSTRRRCAFKPSSSTSRSISSNRSKTATGQRRPIARTGT